MEDALLAQVCSDVRLDILRRHPDLKRTARVACRSFYRALPMKAMPRTLETLFDRLHGASALLRLRFAPSDRFQTWDELKSSGMMTPLLDTCRAYQAEKIVYKHDTMYFNDMPRGLQESRWKRVYMSIRIDGTPEGVLQHLESFRREVATTGTVAMSESRNYKHTYWVATSLPDEADNIVMYVSIERRHPVCEVVAQQCMFILPQGRYAALATHAPPCYIWMLPMEPTRDLIE